MTLERLGHLSQIVSGVILVVGVVLVVMELRQAKALAQAQLISDSFAIQADRLVAQLGEDPAAVLAKACEGTEPLTYADAAVLSTKYQGLLLAGPRVIVPGSTASGVDQSSDFRAT